MTYYFIPQKLKFGLFSFVSNNRKQSKTFNSDMYKNTAKPTRQISTTI